MESTDVPALNSSSSDVAVDDWQVTNWSSAVRCALGLKAMLLFRFALITVLIPSWLVAGYSCYALRPWLLIYVLLAWVGFRNRTTSPNGIGCMAALCVAASGLIFGRVVHDGLLFACALVPGATWVGACIVLGTTGQYLMEKIDNSQDIRDLLLQRRLLESVSNSQ